MIRGTVGTISQEKSGIRWVNIIPFEPTKQAVWARVPDNLDKELQQLIDDNIWRGAAVRAASEGTDWIVTAFK